MTYEEAEEVRDYLAARLLDGVKVHAIGLRKDTRGEWSVGLTAEAQVDIPALPSHLQHVVLAIKWVDGDKWEELPTPLDLAEEERDPTVAVLQTEDGDHVRYIRQEEFERMKELAQVLLDDKGFWRTT